MFNRINRKVTPVKSESAKQYPMRDKQETLRDFVRRVTHEKQLKYRDVAKRAKDGISAATIAQIINNKAGELKPLKVMALAEGLGEPVDLVFALAYPGLKLRPDGFTQSRFEELYTLYGKLSEAEQREVNPSLEMMKLYMERRVRRPVKSIEVLRDVDTLLSREKILDNMETLMDKQKQKKRTSHR